MAIILVVEDEAAIRELLEELLTSENHEVLLAANGQAALAQLDKLQAAQNKVPDLIISDVMMPLMTGIELNQHLQQDTTLKDISFVLLSAAQDPTRWGKNCRFNAFVPKPFNLADFLTTIEQFLTPHKSLSPASS